MEAKFLRRISDQQLIKSMVFKPEPNVGETWLIKVQNSPWLMEALVVDESIRVLTLSIRGHLHKIKRGSVEFVQLEHKANISSLDFISEIHNALYNSKGKLNG